MTLTGWAADYAAELLSPWGDRWAHVQGVVRQARRVAAILLPEEREVLIAAAYLHDLGYAPSLARTGMHALDHARHLRAIGHERLAGLVAYHSGARGEAELRDLSAELGEFEDEASATSMALTYCGMTTSSVGEASPSPRAWPTWSTATARGMSWLSRCAWPPRGRTLHRIRPGTAAGGRGVVVRRSPAEAGVQGSVGPAARSLSWHTA